MSTVHHHHHHHHRLTKRYNLYKILACSTIFFQLSLFCTTLFQLRTFVLFISSKTSSSQGVLGLPIRLLDVGFHLLIFCTLLSSAIRSIWPNQFNHYPTAFPYGNGMVLHFYQQQESSTTKTVHKVINKGLKAYV